MSGSEENVGSTNAPAPMIVLDSAGVATEGATVTFEIGSAIQKTPSIEYSQAGQTAEDPDMPALSFYGLMVEGSPCGSQTAVEEPLFENYDVEMPSTSTGVTADVIFFPQAAEDHDTIEFVKSKKGKNLAIFHNQAYVREKEYKGRIFWKCQEYRHVKCTGRLTTQGNVVVKSSGCTHDSNVIKIAGMQAQQQIKAETESLDSGISLAVTSKVAKLPEHIANAQPPVKKIVKQIQLSNRVKRGKKKTLKIMKDLILDAEDFKLKSGQQFLKYDNGDSENRLIVFSSDKMLSFAARAIKWQGDGTFKIVPLLFIQLYTLHFLFRKLTFPFIFCLMQHKSAESYKQLLVVVRQLLAGTSVKFLVCDFEKAFLICFQKCKIQGCFFHFSQTVFKRIKNSTLCSQYSSDPEYHHLRMLSSLCFVPVKLVPSYFELLVSSPFYENHATELADFVEYMREVWVECNSAQGRRPPQFSVDIWNCYNSVKVGSYITNNHIEGWHSGFSRKLDRRQPSVWLFADYVRIELQAQYSRLSQHAQGKLIKYENASLTPLVRRPCPTRA